MVLHPLRLSLRENQLKNGSPLPQCLLPPPLETLNLTLDVAPSPLNSFGIFILVDFNAHHPTWDTHISPDSAGNSLFNWISSSQLDILNDSNIHTLLRHSSSSRSTPDVSLALSHLAPTREWRILPDLGSDHLPIDINL